MTNDGRLYADTEGAQRLLAFTDLRTCPYRKCKHTYDEGVVLPTGLPFPTNIMISGAWAFHMHDTHGVPSDLFPIMISDLIEFSNSENGLLLDTATFGALMDEQKSRARKDALSKKVGVTIGDK